VNVPKVANQLNQKVEGNKGSPDQTLKEMKQHQQQQFQPSGNQKRENINKSVIKEERKLNNNNIGSSNKD
jgi:hypothetical protein